MEEAAAREYNEPCVQCSDVNWSLTEEGRFYCRSCHNVTERIKEVVTSEITANARAKSISRGLKKKSKFGKCWKWYICEGFQFILCRQADALQSLGVSSRMKDEVLCNFWRRYLQKSRGTYCTEKPIGDVLHETVPIYDSSTEADSELDFTKLISLACSARETDVESESSIGGVSFDKTSELMAGEKPLQGKPGKSFWSGSVDAKLYLQRMKKGEIRMSMPMTLVFCYLALLWLRESITLSDLLRLVRDGHIPYVNVYKDFPEEMKMYGADYKIFHVQSWPAYEDVHKKVQTLAIYLDLPCFPEITEGSFLHPNILCMKYLMEVNLPDDIHNWTCRIVKKTAIGEKDFLTLHPENKSSGNIKYDVLAVAVIITVLKILFLLDDKYEWLLADYAKEVNEDNETGCPVFDIKKWYMVVKNTLEEEQKKFNEERIRYLWRCEKPPIYAPQRKQVAAKRRQMVVDLQKQFCALTGCELPREKQKPSSFKFTWTPERNCFHGHSLDGILQQKGKVFTTVNRVYWLCTTKLCRDTNCCHQFHYKESDFPHTYQFVLNLFSFLLQVQPSLIHEEVCVLEHKLFHSEISNKLKTSKRSRSRSRKRKAQAT